MDERENLCYAYVVEGVTDEDKVKKAGATFVLKTGGVFIRKETLQLFKVVATKRFLVVLTDPDGPGRRIRQLVEKELPQGSWIDVYAQKSTAKDAKKVGIAQMKMRDLGALLKVYLEHDRNAGEKLLYDMGDLLAMRLAGEGSFQRKRRLEEALKVLFPSSKALCRYLNLLRLSKEEVEAMVQKGSEGG